MTDDRWRSIPDRSSDSVFSFDSLVHAEADVIRGYLAQIGRKLKPSGEIYCEEAGLAVSVRS